MKKAVGYIIGEGTRSLPSANDFPWPYGIDFLPGEPEFPIVFSEGVCHGAAAVKVSPSEALSEKWNDHFSIAMAEWFKPLLRRMANDGGVRLEEVLDAYRAAHGTAPKSYEYEVK